MAGFDDMKDGGKAFDGIPGIHAGFPSPSQDYLHGVIDLNRELVRHPEATFFGRVVGDSMSDAGVSEGDVLVIDKSIDPAEGDMAVCFLDGEFCIKFVSVRKDGLWLIAGNGKYAPIHVSEGSSFFIWGVVTYVIRKLR